MPKQRTSSPQWILLEEGRLLQLRPIAPEDAEPIRAGFDLLTPDEIRMRYLHPLKALSADYLHRLTHPVRGSEWVLVIAEPLPPGEALIGAVARMAVVENTREAEFAVLVSHFLSGRGLGRLLLKRLVAQARRRRLHALHGDVLADNTPMLRLAEALGFRRETADAPGLVRVRLELQARVAGKTRA